MLCSTYGDVKIPVRDIHRNCGGDTGCRAVFVTALPPSLSAVLDEAPAVHVAHEAPALHPQDVEAAHALPKRQRNLAGVLLLLRGQNDRISKGWRRGGRGRRRQEDKIYSVHLVNTRYKTENNK